MVEKLRESGNPAGEADLLPYCQSEDIGVMIYSPMHKGLLTGKYKGGESFSDFRANDPDFKGERFREMCVKVQSLNPIANRYGITFYQLVLAATLMHPSIQVAICGIKTPPQIEEAAGAMGKLLSREDYFAVRNAVGPGSPKPPDASGTRK